MPSRHKFPMAAVPISIFLVSYTLTPSLDAAVAGGTSSSEFGVLIDVDTFEGRDAWDFVFFIDKDAVIFAETLLSDAVTAHRQKSIFVTTPGKWECAERDHPPAIPELIYLRRCYKLISRTENSFIVDWLELKRPGFGGEFEKRGRLSAQIVGTRCNVNLAALQITHSLAPGPHAPPRIVNVSCQPIAPA
jgi:hypothetical protein